MWWGLPVATARPVEGLPTFGQALVDHGQLNVSVEETEQTTDLNEFLRLYDE